MSFIWFTIRRDNVVLYFGDIGTSQITKLNAKGTFILNDFYFCYFFNGTPSINFLNIFQESLFEMNPYLTKPSKWVVAIALTLSIENKLPCFESVPNCRPISDPNI